MIRWVRRVANDLGEGRNVELYFTIVLAVLVGALGAFNVLNADVVGSVTLATLALLAYGNIGNRNTVDQLEDRVAKLSVDVRENALRRVRAEDFFVSDRPKSTEPQEGFSAASRSTNRRSSGAVRRPARR